MFIVFGVSVIFVDDLIKKWGEGVERVVGSSINTNSRVNTFAAREYSLLERITSLIFGIL